VGGNVVPDNFTSVDRRLDAKGNPPAAVMARVSRVLFISAPKAIAYPDGTVAITARLRRTSYFARHEPARTGGPAVFLAQGRSFS
jgi:hypothetical protein